MLEDYRLIKDENMIVTLLSYHLIQKVSNYLLIVVVEICNTFLVHYIRYFGNADNKATI